MNNNKGNFLFEFLNQITFIKNPEFILKASESDLKQVNPFILVKWLSMNDDLLILADYLNPLTYNLTTEQLCKICMHLIPKQKMYFKWIGGTKRTKEHTHKFIIDLLKREYELSENECSEYFEIFQKNPKLFIKLIRRYPLEDKELKLLGFTRQQVYSENKLDIKEVKSDYIVTVEKKIEKKETDDWEDLFI